MDFNRLHGQRRSDLEAILDIAEKKKLSEKICKTVIYESFFVLMILILDILVLVKYNHCHGFRIYTSGMLVVITIFMISKLCIMRGIKRRPVLRSKAIKTIIEFFQAYTITIILIIGSLYVKDFFTFGFNSTFEVILFWILIVYQFWYSLVATIFLLLFLLAVFRCEFT